MTKPLLLLVDDSPELGAIVARLGKRAGWDVVVRPDAATGWDALLAGRPTLLLLDVNLPGVSGLELLRRVRAGAALADLPVALFGRLDLAGDVAAALEGGVDFVVSKDLVGEPEQLRRRLEEILAFLHGRAAPLSLICCAEDDSPPPGEWLPAVNRTLRHPAMREVAPGVVRALLRRAIVRAFAGGMSARDLDACLTPDGLALDAQRMPRPLPPRAAFRVAVSLAEQMWRLLGAEPSAPIRAALAAAVPGALDHQSLR